jgi:PmbA protein
MTTALDATAGVDVAAGAVDKARLLGGDDAQVTHTYSELFEITYDTTDVGMVRTTVRDEVSITVFVDGAKGQSSFTGRSPDLVEKAVLEAIAAARSGMADTASAVAPGEPSPRVELGDTEPDKDAMLDTVMRHQQLVAATYPTVVMRDSFYQFRSSWKSFANSAGVQRQERRSLYTAVAVFSARDGERATSMNYTSASAVEPFGELVEMGYLRPLMDDIVRSLDPRPVPTTFVGDVIFTPESLGTLVSPVVQALTGYALMRGTSPFQDSIGEAVADASFTLTNLPRSPQFPLASSFDGDGVPSANLPLITEGVLDNHLVDWYASRKLGRPMTGAVLAPQIAPGTASFDELIAGTERGIVLGRFSGGNPNQKLDFSGVAKNSFYVEDGQIRHPINETMIAGNLCNLLHSIRAIGADVVNYGSHAYPALAASGVTISTK